VAAIRREPLHVFYDGACPVCTRSIAWALKLDRYNRLRPVPAGSPQAHETVGTRHAPNLLEELHVWSERGGVRRGSDAVAAMLVELPWLGWSGRLLGLPPVRPFARLAYRAIAKRRRRQPAREAPVYRSLRRPLLWW
jgi:predicted DCC family thiol-disulfide oxidoreductase YuxK